MNLVPKQRKKIGEQFAGLEGMDLAVFLTGAVQKKIDEAKALLNRYGISPESGYYRRLTDFSARAAQYYASHPQQIPADLEQPKRDYFGRFNGKIARVTVVYDHTFLSRVYGAKVKLSWRFNRHGRIHLLDAMTFPENRICHLIGIKDLSEIAREWGSAEMWYWPLPSEVALVNPGFVKLTADYKYQSLLRFGHSMAKELLENLEEGNVREDSHMRDGQKPLADIVNDEAAMIMMESAGSLMPAVEMIDHKSLMVDYSR